MQVRVRRSFALLVTATLGTLAASALPAAASPDLGPTYDPGDLAAVAAEPHTVTYTVESRGAVATDVTAFAGDAAAVLGDARGWTLGGSVEFVPVASGGDFRLILASPAEVDAAAPGCSPDYSCRVGEQVLINDRNWRETTPAWQDAGAPRWLYRQYLVNHEVGHFLGFGHHGCPSPGAPAPVMQQQSISLEGCAPSGWPNDAERDRLAGRLGVPVHGWVFPDVLFGDTHRDAVHAAAEADIVSGFADGYFRPGHDVRRDQMTAMLTRVLQLTSDATPPFADVPAGATHAEAIAAAADRGLVTGYPDGTFRPGTSVNRAQMATLLARAFALEADGPPPFDDVPADATHAAAIAAVAEHDVAEGYGDGTFRPAEPVTRAQLASFLDRAGAW
ncbi:S-layer homology domain-containing protein [Egicoccus halophilus]|nr:S-layer homology domain-containing protein [Egicoccus halophilus]